MHFRSLSLSYRRRVANWGTDLAILLHVPLIAQILLRMRGPTNLWSFLGANWSSSQNRAQGQIARRKMRLTDQSRPWSWCSYHRNQSVSSVKHNQTWYQEAGQRACYPRSNFASPISLAYKRSPQCLELEQTYLKCERVLELFWVACIWCPASFQMLGNHTAYRKS